MLLISMTQHLEYKVSTEKDRAVRYFVYWFTVCVS